MSRQTKPVFTIESETAFAKQTGVKQKTLALNLFILTKTTNPQASISSRLAILSVTSL